MQTFYWKSDGDYYKCFVYGTVNHVEMRNEILRNIKAAEARSRSQTPETTEF